MGAVMEPYRLVPGFADPAEVEQLAGAVAREVGRLRQTTGTAGIGPRYWIIGGTEILDHLPELAAFGEARVRPLLTAFVGRPVVPTASRAAIRVQVFEGPSREFRWHFDAHHYAALLTLENGNRTETHVIGPGLSRLLRPVLYPLYWLPQLFSLAPYRRIAMGRGDLLLMRGSDVLHRGIARDPGGRRTLIVWAYRIPGSRPNWLRGWVARRVNYRT